MKMQFINDIKYKVDPEVLVVKKLKVIGEIELPKNPVKSLEAVNKQYVDEVVSTIDTTVKGAVVMPAPSFSPDDFYANANAERTWTITCNNYLNNVEIVAFEIDWGDETPVETVPATNNSATVSHTYSGTVGAIYTLTAKAIDALGNKSNPTVKTVTITDNLPPVIDYIDWNASELFNNAVYLVTIYARDPEFQPITYSVTCDDPNIVIEDTETPNTKRISVPDYQEDTPVTFTYRVSDGVNVTVKNETKTIKNNNGCFLIIRNTGDNREDVLTSIKIDSNGNIFAAGYTRNGSYTDFYIVKLDKNFNVIKQIHIPNRTNNSTDILNSIEIDENNNIYVAGYTSVGNQYHLYLAKLNNDLIPIKQVRLQSPTVSLSGVIKDIKFSNDGYLYVAGNTINGSYYDFYLAKFDKELNPIKQITINDNEYNGHHGLNSIAIDSNNKIFVSGYINNGSNKDIYVAKLDSDFNPIKQISMNVSNESLEAIDVDPNGNVFVSGYVGGSFYIAKLDNNLNMIKQITLGYYHYNNFKKVIVDKDGYVYALGHYYNGIGFAPAYIVKFDNNLNPIKQITIFRTAKDEPLSGLIGEDGYLYIVGTSADGVYSDAIYRAFFIGKINVDSIPNGQTQISGPPAYKIITQNFSFTEQIYLTTEKTYSTSIENWTPVTETWNPELKNWPSYLTTFSI